MDHTNSFFATILENSSPTLVTDISGRILYVNRPALTLLERCRPFKRPNPNIINDDPEPSSFIDSHYTSIIEPLDAYEATSLRNHFMNNVQILSKRTHVCRTIKCRTFSSKRPIMLEFSTRTCSTEGRNLILISTIRDVTDSKFQEFILDEADRRMSITYDVIGVITEVSRSCKSILGYEPDELLGMDGYSFIHPEDTTNVRTIHAKRAVEKYGTTLQRQSFRHLKKDGSYCLLEIWSQGIQPDGSWSFVSFDITDASEYIDNRSMTSEQCFIRKLLPKNVEGESRDKAANNFVSFICHELRNPLNGITGFTSLLLDTELSEQQRDFAEAISSISNYMCNIINQSIDLCQTQSHGTTSSEIGPLKLREIVEFGFLTVTVLARTKGTELILQDQLTPFQMTNGTKNVESKWYGDEDIVRKILLNYLTNAIKHTGSGVVTVRLEVESDKLQNGKEGFMAKCSVEDTGPGIPQKDLKRLFLPYSKLVSSFGELKSLKEGNNGTRSPNHQQSQRSSGLGLSICKELADKMGGKVGVESVLGKGSTFWFTFPVYTNMPEDIDDDPDNGTETNSGRSEGLKDKGNIKEIFLTKDILQTDGISLVHSSSSTSPVTSNSTKTSVNGANGINGAKGINGTNGAKGINGTNGANGESRRKHRKPTKVLMVEDNEINQRLALQYLEKMGEKVTIAANGIEALEKMKNETFDILFVDLQMPYMDGYTLTRRIREAEREAERETCQCDTRSCELPSYNVVSSTPPPTPPGSSSTPTNGHQSVIPFISLIKSPSPPTPLHISTQSSPIITSTSSASSSSSSNYSSSSSSSESSSSSYSHSQLPSPTTSSSNCGLSKDNVTLKDSHQPVPSSPPISPPSSHKRHKHVPIVACTANVLEEEKGRCKQHGMDGFLSKPYKMEQMKQCIEELVEDDDESLSGRDEEKNVESRDYNLQIKPIKQIKQYEKVAPI